MSYLVLARKYRPRSFETLVGQEHVVQALSNALTQGRLHHAYLFTGTRGVGKTTVSRILAKSLNCVGVDGQSGITATPCGVCNACRDIDSGRFVDYVELDAASNRGVDEISQLLDQAVYKPVMGRFKVYMIDEVHMLTNHAFNAMLKTLEEPPDYLKFVLATTDPQKVPPTVLSRCLQFNLRPMAPQTVQSHLVNVLADEQIEAEAGALRLLSRAARGSMRDALSLADQAIAFGGGTLSEVGVRQMLGAVDRSHAVRLIEALVSGDGAALVSTADALRTLGLSASGTLEEMAALLQQMAVAAAVPTAIDATDVDSPAVLRLAPLLAADETQLFYSMALHGRAELSLAPDEYSGLVMVLLPDHMYFYTGGVNAFKYAATRPQQWPPNTVGRYRNVDPVLINYLIRLGVEKLGEDYLSFPQRALFDKIGVRTMVMETDPYGNFLTQGYEFASARDWARLGNLYLQNGVWNGERILPEGYANFVSTLAPAWKEDGRLTYGGFFWLNGNEAFPIPKDAYYMAGAGGQYAFIIPSHDLVVVRLGHYKGAGAGLPGLKAALAILIDAVPKHGENE